MERNGHRELNTLPTDWLPKQVSKFILDKLQNGAFVQKPQKGKGLLFANVVNMYGGIYLDYTTLERIDVSTDEVERYFLNENDLLVVRSSLKREGIGQNCIAKNLSEPVFYDCHLIRVVPDQEQVYPEFLSYYWRSPIGKQDLIQRSKTTTMTTINQASLSSAVLTLPPLNEQKKIAYVLSTVQRAIAQQEQIIQATTELKKALMHKLFTEGLHGEKQKETEIGLVPESWDYVEVGTVCRSIVPGRNKPKRFDGDIPWVTTPEIKELTFITHDIPFNNFVSKEHLEEIGGKVLPKESVIMTCVGDLGISAVAKIPLVINQQLHAFVCPDNLDPYFLCQMLRVRKNYMNQIAHKTTVQYLNKSKCESVPIAIPGNEEQQEISKILLTIDSKIQILVSKKKTLEELFQNLLHQLMTAQIRVHDIDLPGFDDLEEGLSHVHPQL